MKHKKGLTIEECVRRAKKFIDSQGVCLLLYDIKESRNFEVNEFVQKRREMQESLNNKFSKYMPKNDLDFMGIFKKGFQIYRGDAAVAGINSAEIIPEIVKYQKEMFPDVQLYWSVAKDGFDKKGYI